MKKLRELPRSDDRDFWDGEKIISNPVKVPICSTHGKNWQDHNSYKDNHNGTISCQFCGWGCFLPGYMKVHDGKVYDLRTR